MILLTAAMFTKGFTLLAILSGVVLLGMMTMALGMFGLAWNMTDGTREEEYVGLAAQPG